MNLKLELLFVVLLTFYLQSSICSDGVEFEYYESGDDWSGLCGSGTKQSPIDIPTTRESTSSNAMQLVYNKNLNIMITQQRILNQEVKDIGDTIKVYFSAGGMAFWDENNSLTTFKIMDFHMHAPSEHTFDGKAYDVEVHLVHRNPETGKLAVIGIYFDVEKGGDQKSEFIDSLYPSELTFDGDTVISPKIPLLKLLESIDKSQLFHYHGSLTTPPCYEGVEWIIINDPQPISTEQLNQINSHWLMNEEFAHGNGNNREVQPLNGRKIFTRVDVQTPDLMMSYGSWLKNGITMSGLIIILIGFIY